MYFFVFWFFLSAWPVNGSVDKEEANKKTAELRAQTMLTQEKSLRPSYSHLKILSLLQRLESILKEKEKVDFPKFSPKKSLRLGDKDESIIILRQILQSLGYLEKVTDSPFFDMEIEKAVKAFQAGHYLEEDGVVGDETAERLNWPYAKRRQMVSDSIEKIKNLIFLGRVIIVNIPTYSLYAYDDQKLIMSMKAIIGKPNHATPLMTSYIDKIEFNPVWVVPHPVLFEDALPKIQEDSEFFSKSNMRVFDRNDNEVDPGEVDWADVDINDFPYVFKQVPGKTNALGLIRFSIKDDEYIYLHDTPNQELFKKRKRAFSFGCIRIEQSGKLAAWILKKEKEEIKSDIETGETMIQNLDVPVTLYITYIPVWIAEEFADGRVLWGDNPYKFE